MIWVALALIEAQVLILVLAFALFVGRVKPILDSLAAFSRVGASIRRAADGS